MKKIGVIARPFKSEEDFKVLGVVDDYCKSIIKCGGLPIIITPPQLVDYYELRPKEIEPLSEIEKEMLIEQIKLCDGILMPGGIKRFEYDRFITEYVLENNIPVLGICMGFQLLATHLDFATLSLIEEPKLNHQQLKEKAVHEVEIFEDAKLYKIIGKKNFTVNSRHSYEVTVTGNFKVAAKSEDGIIEAVEWNDKKFAIGVQWHPESLFETEESEKLFRAFIESC